MNFLSTLNPNLKYFFSVGEGRLAFVNFFSKNPNIKIIFFSGLGGGGGGGWWWAGWGREVGWGARVRDFFLKASKSKKKNYCVDGVGAFFTKKPNNILCVCVGGGGGGRRGVAGSGKLE